MRGVERREEGGKEVEKGRRKRWGGKEERKDIGGGEK